jgi:hypothetical protein
LLSAAVFLIPTDSFLHLTELTMISLLMGFFMFNFFMSKGGNSLASLAAACAMALI